MFQILSAALAPILALVVVSTALAQPIAYPTRDGPKTADQLQFELAAAGYPGPWDVNSMLAAYARATAPRPTPAPMPAVDPALSAGCFEWASAALMTVAPYMPTKTDFGAALRGLQDGCQAAARDKGAIGVSCFENGANQWLVGNALYGGVNASFIDAYYRLCAGALAL